MGTTEMLYLFALYSFRLVASGLHPYIQKPVRQSHNVEQRSGGTRTYAQDVLKAMAISCISSLTLGFAYISPTPLSVVNMIKHETAFTTHQRDPKYTLMIVLINKWSDSFVPSSFGAG